MASPSAGSGSLPAPKAEIVASPLESRLSALYAFLSNAGNLDEGNADLTSADGLVGKSTAQTIAGLKTFSGGLQLSGSGLLDLQGIADCLVLDDDGDTTISAPTDDQVDIEIGGSDLITLATAGSTFKHPVTVGVDDAGHDVKLFGATSGKYALWDESEDTLQLTDSTNLTFGTGGDADVYYDGTNLVVNPKVVGSGYLSLLGELRPTGSVVLANNLGVGFRNAADSGDFLFAKLTSGNVLQLGDLTNLSTTTEFHAGGSARTYLDTSGNYGVGTGTFGASAAKVLGLANGTQGGAAADMVQLTSEDLSAGNTILSIRTEGSGVISAGTPGTAEGTIALKVNGTVYYIPYDTAPAS